MPANALQVFVLLDGQLLTSEVFGEGSYSIGSEAGSDLLLPANEIAPKHAVLQFRGTQVTVRDLGSSLGTFVNGQHVGEAPVTSADDINVGPYLLKVRQLARKSTAPAPRPTGLASPVQSSNVVPIGSAGPTRVPAASMPTPRPGSMTALALADTPSPATVIPLHPQTEPSQPDINVDELLNALDHTLGTEEPAPAAPAPKPVAPPAAPVAKTAPAQKPVAPPAPPVAKTAPAQKPVAPPPPAQKAVPTAPAAQKVAPPPKAAPPAPAGPPSVPPVQQAAPPPAPAGPPSKPPAGPPSKPPAQRAAPPPAPVGPPSKPPEQRAAPAPAAPLPPPPAPAAPLQVAPAASAAADDLPVIEGELTPGMLLPGNIPIRPPTPAPLEALPPRPLEKAAVPAGPATQPPRAAAPAPSTFEKLQLGERLRVVVSWGHHPVSIRSFAPGQTVVAGAHETAAIPLYGFHLTSDRPLASSSAEGWSVSVPPGATAIVVDANGRSQSLPPTPGGVRLALNRPVRLSIGNLQVELTRHIPPPPGKAGLRQRDWAFLVLLVLLAIPAAVFVHFAPDPPKVRPPPDPEIVRQYVQEMFERKPPPRHVEPPRHEVQRAPPPKPLAEAKTLQAATDALRPVDQVARATKEIDNVVSALNKISPLKAGAGARDALAGLGDLPKIPMNGKLAGGTGGGIGDLNALGGPLGPGASALNGAGKLGNGTAGAGHVRGVPISVPKKPQKIQGQIDRDALARVINEHVNEMRNCYERALLRDPNIGAGKVTLEWTIGAMGSVTEVSTKTSTLRSSEVVSCLLDVIRRLQFPKPDGGVVIVSYPILFNSVGY